MRLNATDFDKALRRVRVGNFKRMVREGPNPRDFSNAPVHFSIEGLTAYYNRTERRAGRPGLKDVGFSVKKGEVVYVMGENGQGKSTLLDILANRSKAKYIDGTIDIAGKVYSFKPSKRQPLFTLGNVGLWDENDHNNQGSLGETFREHSARGTTSLVVSHHDINNIFRHADHVLFINKGRIILDDTPANIMARWDSSDNPLPKEFIDLIAPLIKNGQWDMNLTRAILEKPVEPAPILAAAR